MRSAVEISMYPLAGDYRPLIQAFIDRLNTYPDMTVRTNRLSTQVWGPLDRVMAMVAAEIERSAAAAPAAGVRHEGAARPGPAVIEALWVQLARAWRTTSWVEILAVVLAVAYLLLAIRQSIACWMAAFVSSCLYVWVLFGARLYMESVLNVFYAAMAVYGFWQWRGREDGAGARREPLAGRAQWVGAGGSRRAVRDQLVFSAPLHARGVAFRGLHGHLGERVRHVPGGAQGL